MGPAEFKTLLAEKLSDAVRSMDAMLNNDLLVVVDEKRLIDAVGTLKNEPSLGFSTLMNHLGVDYGDRMAVIYNLYSPLLRQKVTVKAFLERDAPEVPSLVRAFPGIDWFERETYDLLGIRFTGHGNLKRLLLPEDWEGHPLRKDYVLPETYGGMETARHDLFDAENGGGEDHV